MIHIVTDTTAGLPQATLDAYGIPAVPQYVHFGTETVRDQFEMTPAEFYARQAAASELPKTSAPPVGDYLPIFERIRAEDPTGTVLCVHPSTEISGTVRSARAAAADFPDLDIRIFDTRSVSVGLGLMVLEAAEMVEAGESVDAILARLAAMRDAATVLFVVDTLEYLAKGGRIGRAQHLMGSLLDIKPILALVDGVVSSHSRARTRKRSLAQMRDLVLEGVGPNPDPARLRIGVAHGICEDEGRMVYDALVEQLDPAAHLFAEIGPSIGVHAGPRAVAVCWIEV